MLKSLLLAATLVALTYGHGYECKHDKLNIPKQTLTVPYNGQNGQIRVTVDSRTLPETLKDSPQYVAQIQKLVDANVNTLTSKLNVDQASSITLKDVNNCGPAQVPEDHKTLGVENTDMLLYVTASAGGRCSHRNNVFAYADVCAYDQKGRPVAGFIEFCFKKLEGEDMDLQNEETLHHLVHVFLMSPQTMQNAGIVPQVVAVGPNGEKFPVISSPNVLEFAKHHYGCEKAPGALIQGSHWSSTHMFGELMAPHAEEVSGEPLSVLSGFTMSLFMDTPWYTLRGGLHEVSSQYAVGLKAGCEYFDDAAPGFVAATFRPENDHPRMLKVVKAAVKRVKNGKRRLLPSTYTSADEAAILNLHNSLRSQLAGGSTPGFNSASDMLALSWNTDMQKGAQTWSNQCLVQHDSAAQRQAASNNYPTYLGQNLAWGTPASYYGSQAKVLSLVQSWWDEYKFWTYGTMSGTASCQSGQQCGHFTQMAWAKTSRIGCGVNTACTVNYEVMLSCNYGDSGGNYGGQYVYTQGAPCSKCPTGLGCANNMCGSSGPVPTPQPTNPTPPPTPRPTNAGPAPTPPPTQPSGGCPNLGITYTITLGNYFNHLTGVGASQYQTATMAAHPCIKQIIYVQYSQYNQWWDYVKIQFKADKSEWDAFNADKTGWRQAIYFEVQKLPGVGAAVTGTPPSPPADTATGSCTGSNCAGSSNNNGTKDSAYLIALGAFIGAICICSMIGGYYWYRTRHTEMDKNYALLDEHNAYPMQ